MSHFKPARVFGLERIGLPFQLLPVFLAIVLWGSCRRDVEEDFASQKAMMWRIE